MGEGDMLDGVIIVHEDESEESWCTPSLEILPIPECCAPDCDRLSNCVHVFINHDFKTYTVDRFLL